MSRRVSLLALWQATTHACRATQHHACAVQTL